MPMIKNGFNTNTKNIKETALINRILLSSLPKKFQITRSSIAINNSVLLASFATTSNKARVNFFSRYEKRNQYTHIIFDDHALVAQKEKNRWFGGQNHSQDRYGFEDINIVRLFGNDVVDLDQTVLVGRDNIVVIRKIFGKTKIILPIDVEISVSASSIYGRVQFLDLSFWDLRNESISIASPGYRDSHKRVKVVVNSLFGDVEVIRV